MPAKRKSIWIVIASLSLLVAGGAIAYAVIVQPGSPLPSAGGSSTATSLASLTKEELILQVKQLQQTTDLEGRLRPYAPLAAAFVAAGGLIWSIRQYGRDQRRQRTIRVEEGLIKNLDVLAKAPSDESITIGQTISCFRNVALLLQGSDDPSFHESWVTDVIAAIVREDLDLSHSRQARFDTVCFQQWKPYRHHQAQNESSNVPTITKYVSALKAFSEKNRSFTRTVAFNAQHEIKSNQSVEPEEFTYFTRLIAGLSNRITLLSPPDRDGWFVRVKEVTNSQFSSQLEEVTGNNLGGANAAQVT
jgi:hypothetical protein